MRCTAGGGRPGGVSFIEGNVADADLEKITAWRLPIEHPEGLAFDGDTVYIASDTEERLYVFELD